MPVLRRHSAVALLLALVLTTAGVFAHVHMHVDLCGHQEHDHHDCVVCLVLSTAIAALPLLLLLSLPALQARRLAPAAVAVATVSNPVYFFRRGPPIG